MNLVVLNLIPVLFVGMLFVGIKKADSQFLSLESSKSLKGFAAIGVILHHLTQINTNYNQFWKGPINLWNEMGILFTGIFFFLSGYGLWMSFHNKPNYLDTFLKKRIPTVLIPFLVSNLIYTLIMGIPFGIVKGPTQIIGALIGILLVNTNTWYLVEILIIYLGFYYFYKNYKEETAQKGLILLLTIIVIIGIFSGHNRSMYGLCFRGEWWYNTTFVFITGALFAKHKESILKFLNHNYARNCVFGIVLWISLMVLDIYGLTRIGYYYQPNLFIGTICKLLLCTIQTLNATMFIGLLLLFMIKRKIGNRYLSFIGDISLELYVIHNLIRLGSSYLFGMKDTTFYLVVLSVSVVLAYPLHKLDQFLIKKL